MSTIALQAPSIEEVKPTLLLFAGCGLILLAACYFLLKVFTNAEKPQELDPGVDEEIDVLVERLMVLENEAAALPQLAERVEFLERLLTEGPQKDNVRAGAENPA